MAESHSSTPSRIFTNGRYVIAPTKQMKNNGSNFNQYDNRQPLNGSVRDISSVQSQPTEYIKNQINQNVHPSSRQTQFVPKVSMNTSSISTSTTQSISMSNRNETTNTKTIHQTEQSKDTSQRPKKSLLIEV